MAPILPNRSAASLVGPQFEVAVAVVDRVDRDAGRDDLVDGVEHVGRQPDVCGGQERLQLLHGARADDRRGDTGVVDDEGDGELDQREAGLLGQDRELLDGVEFALVGGGAHVEAGLRARAGEAGPSVAFLR